MVCVDLVVTFTIKTPLKTHSLLALTMIDFDNEGEFKREFKQMCNNYCIKVKLTTSHNPQANAIIERIHKVVNELLRSLT
jgi:hypothetical protein